MNSTLDCPHGLCHRCQQGTSITACISVTGQPLMCNRRIALASYLCHASEIQTLNSLMEQGQINFYKEEQLLTNKLFLQIQKLDQKVLHQTVICTYVWNSFEYSNMSGII